MKKTIVFMLAVLPFFGLAAQGKGSMSLNGVTGLYVVPTAHIGWEDSGIGFNAGYHVNFPGGVRNNNLFQVNLSIFKWIEIAGTYDGQPRTNDDDVLLGVKFKLDSILPIKTNFALGANVHYNDIAFSGRHWMFQFYGVVSYNAEFFSWPAETTLIAGKSFFEGQNPDSGVDFGMGFDLILLPKHLKNFIHWIIDFSNFNYSAAGWGLDTGRGILNTGIRIDLGQIPALSKFNFVIDAYLADAFDDSGHGIGRTFGFGLTFGVKL
jgi:hypothetical protein